MFKATSYFALAFENVKYKIQIMLKQRSNEISDQPYAIKLLTGPSYLEFRTKKWSGITRVNVNIWT